MLDDLMEEAQTIVESYAFMRAMADLDRTDKTAPRWRDELGTELLGRIEQACHAANLGWVPAGDLQALPGSLARDEIIEDVRVEYDEPAEEKQPPVAGAAPAPVQLRLPFRRG